MGRYIKASQGHNHTVIYTDESGKKYRFSGGTWAWRNHNPGNLRRPRKRKIKNVIGMAGGFLVFSDYRSGHQALLDTLKTTYRNKSIPMLVKIYAPAVDHNDVARYTKFLQDKTGVTDNRKLKDFTSQAFKKLWQAIEKMEGSEKGKITRIKQVKKVRKNKKGSISEFLISPIGWITKEAAVQMALQGELDLVLCKLNSGERYLRSRPDCSVNNNLSHLV